ncbi:hypothetical protein BEH_07145 [Priestia filamentosa]|uniref:Pectate lyase superfamily protein domain-containing protein n=1 Tax=Priestia filamentosa TaxID=1402861 RepID=A0A0H4KGG4_9BACI|nr:hypothetical protein [Priestia filamentosa]AKO91896.1 hypothetical protein BEH_07145 [Priestia filamentosa]
MGKLTKVDKSVIGTGLMTDISSLQTTQSDQSFKMTEITKQDINPLLPPFNAKGDGTTDDTVAIQNAIDSLTTGGRLILTKKFKVTTITLKANVSIIGIGQEKSGFISSSETILLANAGTVRFCLANFGIWGSSTTSTAIKLSGAGGGVADFSIRDVYIKGCLVGINLFFCWAFALDRVRMQDCMKGMRLESQTNQGNISACSFKVKQIATELFNCNGINFIGCEFAGANHDGTVPITLYQSTAVNFIGNYVEFFANAIPLFQIGYATGVECSGISINSNYISHDGSVGIIAIYNGRGISICYNHTRNFTGYIVRDYGGNITGLTVEGNASQLIESNYTNVVPNYGFFAWANGTSAFPSDTETMGASTTGILGTDGSLEITTAAATQGYRHKVNISDVGYLTYETEIKSSVDTTAYVDFFVDGAYKNSRSISLTANTYKKVSFVEFINGSSVTYIRIRFSAIGTHNIKTLRAYRGIVTLSKDKKPSLFSDSKPVNGTFKKGDTVTNSNPASGSYERWVCTVAGTAGTWKGIGLIEA